MNKILILENLLYITCFWARQGISDLFRFIVVEPYRRIFLPSLKCDLEDSTEKDFGDYQFETLLPEHKWRYVWFLRTYNIGSKISGVQPAHDAYPRLLMTREGRMLFCFTKRKTRFSYKVLGTLDNDGSRWVNFGWVINHSGRAKFLIRKKETRDGDALVIKCVALSGDNAGKEFEIKKSPESLKDLKDFMEQPHVFPPPSALEYFGALGFAGLSIWKLVAPLI